MMLGVRLNAAALLSAAAVLFAWWDAAWAGEAIPLQQLKEATHIHGIAVDRADPTRLLLATHHGFFVLAADGTATRVSPVQDFMGFTPHPSDPSVLYASGHPAGGGNLGFIVSTDGGVTWTQVSQGAGAPVDFHQMDVSEADPKVVFGAYAGSLQASRDGGMSWSVVGPAPEGLIDLAASPSSVDRLYAATRFGLWLSEDGGATWKVAAFEPDIVSMVAGGPNGTIIAFVVGKGLVQSEEADLAAWTTLSNDFGDRALLHLAVDPSDANRFYAVTHQGEVLASADGGRNWTPFAAR